MERKRDQRQVKHTVLLVGSWAFLFALACCLSVPTLTFRPHLLQSQQSPRLCPCLFLLPGILVLHLRHYLPHLSFQTSCAHTCLFRRLLDEAHSYLAQAATDGKERRIYGSPVEEEERFSTHLEWRMLRANWWWSYGAMR